MNVLVLSAGGPAGVNFCKSLLLKSCKGFPIVIFGADSNKYHVHLSQPYTIGTFLIPHSKNENEYVKRVNEIINNNSIDFVHAQSDAEVKVLSDNRSKIKAKTFLPDKKVINIFQDKYRSAMLWHKAGLCEEPINIEIRANLTQHDLTYALKKFGGKIWLRATEGAGGRGSTPCENVGTGYNWIRYWRSKDWRKNSEWDQWEWMAQPYLPGRNIAWHSLWKKGELIVSQARERLEYIYPNLAPSGITGTPSVQRTINDEKVNWIGKCSVETIDKKPNGIYCVDLKENEKGEPVPTEVNAGRFFTTSFFFSNLGERLEIPRANMPYMYLLLGMDMEFPKGNTFNILPDNMYWIRHMDCNPRMIKGDEIGH
jgi:carbamoyl-phosphate synthase large subunit